jgi:flagellar M-ring protein FliF
VLALVSLFLGLFVVRPLLSQSRPAATALAVSAGPMALSGPTNAASEGGLTGEIADGFDMPSLPGFNFEENGMPGGHPTDPVSRLRRLIDERQAESIEILRNWMEKEEERS